LGDAFCPVASGPPRRATIKPHPAGEAADARHDRSQGLAPRLGGRHHRERAPEAADADLHVRFVEIFKCSNPENQNVKFFLPTGHRLDLNFGRRPKAEFRQASASDNSAKDSKATWRCDTRGPFNFDPFRGLARRILSSASRGQFTDSAPHVEIYACSRLTQVNNVV
jgi:hypothetical protein